MCALDFLLICSVLFGLQPGVQAMGKPPDQPEQLSFMPKLKLKWPGKPSESSQILATRDGEQKHYDAMFADKRPDGVVLFFAAVEEFPEEALKASSAKDLLLAYVFAFRKEETSRKELEHGPKKHPGLEISSQRTSPLGMRFCRRLVVFAGQRIYEISVSSKDKESLERPEVKAFLKSLAIADQSPNPRRFFETAFKLNGPRVCPQRKTPAP
jgi:hypothetical protein